MLEQIWRNIPPVVKNLLLINLMMFVALLIFQARGTDLNEELGLYNVASSEFRPFQIITHMFMHGNFVHIFFNMFALISFGAILERLWGPKRFLLFYLITGIGAVVLYSITNYVEYSQLVASMNPEEVDFVKENGLELINSGRNWFGDMGKLNANLFTPMVGASGAIYGLLVAFGMLFPNTEMMLIFLPVPIKAKYFIPILIALALFGGFSDSEGDNVAHFAHLGGALFGFILVKFWNKNRNNFY
jgi:membrane associated rhomboid family serine protease